MSTKKSFVFQIDTCNDDGEDARVVVKVTVPKGLLEEGRVTVPEYERCKLGTLRVYMDKDCKNEVQFQTTQKDAGLEVPEPVYTVVESSQEEEEERQLEAVIDMPAPQQVTLYYYFDSSTQVPLGKLQSCGLESVEGVAWRNEKVKVRVTLPGQALKQGLVQTPERNRGHISYLQIQAQGELVDQITCEVVGDRHSQLNLLATQVIDLPDNPGYKLLALELPPPVSEVFFRIQLPYQIHGEFCANGAVWVTVNNVVGTMAPYQGKGGNKVMNHRVSRPNNHWLNYYINRAEDDGREYNEKFFWPGECQLEAAVTQEMEAHPDELLQNGLEPAHQAILGAHPDLLQSIRDEQLRVYMVPEAVPSTRQGRPRVLSFFGLPRLISSWDQTRISETLPGSGTFAPRTDTYNDFYCCFGVDDPRSNQNYTTGAAFGRQAPLYQVRHEGKRRKILEDENGGPKLQRKYSGYMVVLQFKTMFQILATLYEYMANGMMADLERHRLLLPDELFIEEDAAERNEHKAQMRQQEKRQRQEEKRKAAKAEHNDGEAQEPSLAGDETLSFGKFGGTLDEPDEADEAETDDGQDGEEDNDSPAPEDSFPV